MLYGIGLRILSSFLGFSMPILSSLLGFRMPTRLLLDSFFLIICVLICFLCNFKVPDTLLIFSCQLESNYLVDQYKDRTCISSVHNIEGNARIIHSLQN